MIEIKRVLAMAVIPFVAGITCVYTTDCQPQEPPVTVTQGQKQTIAEGSFGAELLNCLDPKKYKTVKDIDACADDVRRRWPRGMSSDGGVK